MLHVRLTSLATKKPDNLATQTVALSEQNANHPLLQAAKQLLALLDGTGNITRLSYAEEMKFQIPIKTVCIKINQLHQLSGRVNV
jgi:hypothetical protein